MEEENKVAHVVDGKLVENVYATYEVPVMDVVEVAKWIHDKLPEDGPISVEDIVDILELEMDWMVENGYAVNEEDAG